MKTNVLTQGYSGALKLNIGTIDGRERLLHHDGDLAKKIVDILEAANPDISILTVTRYSLANEKIKLADFILKPDVDMIHWADFNRIDECIQTGRDSATQNIKDIRRVIGKKGMLGFFMGKW